ncbi:MAG: DUF58 domain-containing protein [Chloroflexota bacterium]
MFGEVGRWLLGGALVLSLATRESALFLLSLSLLVAAWLSGLWQRHCLDGVEYRRRFNHREVSPGEQVELEIEIVNRKLLPLSWLEAEDELPKELSPSRGRTHPSHKPERILLPNLLALRPYERVRRRYAIPCHTRGEHFFGPVRLRSGDLFGSGTSETTLPLVESIVVYPKVLPLSALGLPAGNPLGDTRGSSWIFEDASRVAGAREYRPGDGLRRIHWPASVREQRLMVRAYEATFRQVLAIFLNVATDEEVEVGFRYDPAVLELGISTAASLADWALAHEYEVGLRTNGMYARQGGRVSVPSGRGLDQLAHLLRALGRLQNFAIAGFADLLTHESSGLPFGATVVIVTPALAPPIAAGALALRARGHRVVMLLTGRQSIAPSLAGIAVQRVSRTVADPEGAVLAFASTKRTR